MYLSVIIHCVAINSISNPISEVWRNILSIFIDVKQEFDVTAFIPWQMLQENTHAQHYEEMSWKTLL